MAGNITVESFSAAQAAPVEASRAGWIHSPTWDKRWIIYPAFLAPVPILVFYLSMYLLERYTGADASTRMGIAEDITSLFVMLLAGGPHVWVTYTRTYLNPDFRRREKVWFTASLFVVPFVATMALSSETSRRLLMTGFFFLASLHLIHQLSYVVRFYHDRDAAKPSLKSRLIDVAAVMFPLYPVSSFRMVLGNHDSLAWAWTSQWLGVDKAASLQFHIGRAQPMLPDFILSDWFWMANTAGLVLFTGLWIAKTMREHQQGKLHHAKVLLIVCAIGVGLFAPLWPNLDSSFQGFNLWHSMQYIALTWFITRQQVQKGSKLNPLVKWLAKDERSGFRYYGVALAIVVFLIGVIMLIAVGISLTREVGMFGGSGEPGTPYYKPGAVLQAYYLLGFGLLLTHYFHDAFFFNCHTFSKSVTNTRA